MGETAKKQPKEIDVFNRFTKHNKLKVTLIAMGIALVAIVVLYCFCKSLMIYTITIDADGGLVYGQELEVAEYRFWQRSKEPVGLKKEGYYIEGYYKDPKFTERYEFGGSIWNSLKLYVNWQPGYAVKLNFAEGEEEWSNMSLEYLKTYHEQYVKGGSRYTLHKVINDIPYLSGINHENEQLLWFEDAECSGDPIEIKTYVVDRNINLYGKWFDTDVRKFDISFDGTLNKYLGYCNKIILPSRVRRIKSIDETGKFQTGSSDQQHEQDGKYYSTFQNVMHSLEIIYINSECETLGACAFRECDALEKVYFKGDGLREIGEQAFAKCEKLFTITIPKTVTSIGKRAFYGTDELITIGGGLGVTTIGQEAFLDSRQLIEVNMPKVSFVGRMAFANCISLKRLILGYASVVATDVTDASFGANNNNILKNSSSAKIYVPATLVNVYKSTSPWSSYADRILDMNALNN